MKATRILIATGLVLGLGAAALAILPNLLFGDGVDYASVASIKKEASYQDPALLAAAFELPNAARYQSAGIEYQANGSFCGPTSVANALRSTGADPKIATQKQMLDGTNIETTFGVLLGGITLDQLADVAIARFPRAAEISLYRDLELDALRALLVKANDPAYRLIANFHRGPLFATGGGHHSPIAGYLADKDLVLVLDVNEKYKPWLVSSERLFRAIDTVDKSSGKKRGVLEIKLPGEQ